MSEAELASLKSTLRSLVVSSPTRVDLRSLLRDYRSLIGEHLPLNRFGYRDPLTFLKERCSDCFLGIPSNPFLTLIVPETLKHIDKFVQSQKATSSTKLKGKRTSIPENVSHIFRQDMIVSTYNKKHIEKTIDPKPTNTSNEKPRDLNSNIIGQTSDTPRTPSGVPASQPVHSKDKIDCENISNLRAALARRLAASRDLCKPAASAPSDDDGASAHTSSSHSSTKQAQLEELKDELHAVIKESKDGVWCTELVMRYREKYDRVPEFTRFGHTTIGSFVQALGARVRVTQVAGRGWMLQDAAAPPASPPPPPAAPRAAPRPARSRPSDEDALPGVPYAPDVFPADCLRFEESVPAPDLSAVRPGLNLEVIVGEVYSPSHFWLIRLGPEHNIAMEELMDEMTEYFESGEGAARYLAAGAVCVGQYCAALYDRDWHRAIIVDLLDGEELVKVRHVDYGTVDTVPAGTLRPLPRRWARLPAQAVRARQAGVRPAAAGRRWPPAACSHFLQLVRDRALIASVVAVDAPEATLEVFLVDTSGAEDDDLARDLRRAGFADERRDTALRAEECYLYPRFAAIESGATPNYAEIQRYLRDGITLDYVPAYRRHVPAALPPLAPAPPPSPPPPALTAVPLIRPQSPAHTSAPALPTSAPPPAPAPVSAQHPQTMQTSSSCYFPPPQVPFCPPPPSRYGPPPPPAPYGPPPPLASYGPPPPGPYGATLGPPPELWLSAADWAMYERLSATANWYKVAAMQGRSRLAAPPPPPLPLHPPLPRYFQPPPGF